MPRNTIEYNIFKEKKLFKFLLNDTANNLIANAELMQEYAKLRDIPYQALITPQTPEYKKHINYFRCLRKHVAAYNKAGEPIPETKTKYEEFKQKKLTPFLMQNNAKELIQHEELMRELAEIKNITYEELTAEGSPQYLKHLKEFKSLRTKVNQYKKPKTEQFEKIPKRKILFKETEEVVNNLQLFNMPEPNEQEKLKQSVFKNNITEEAFEGLENQVEFLKNARKDLTYYLQGGTEEQEITQLPNGKQTIRNRILTSYIQEYKAINVLLKNNGISKGKVLTGDQQRSLMTQLKLIENLALSPFKLLDTITEMSFQAQRELQGAILNDQALPETQDIKDKGERERNEKFIELFRGLYDRAGETKVFAIEKKK